MIFILFIQCIFNSVIDERKKKIIHYLTRWCRNRSLGSSGSPSSSSSLFTMWAILYTAGSMILATGERYCAMLWIWSLFGRAVDPHSFFADSELFFSMRIRIQLLFYCGSKTSVNKVLKNYLTKSFLELKRTKKIAQK